LWGGGPEGPEKKTKRGTRKKRKKRKKKVWGDTARFFCSVVQSCILSWQARYVA